MPDENFNLQKFCFPSKFVEELIVLAHSLQVEKTALRYLSQQDVAQIYWQVFERGCILALTFMLLGPSIPMKKGEWDPCDPNKIGWGPIDIFPLPHRTDIFTWNTMPVGWNGPNILL